MKETNYGLGHNLRTWFGDTYIPDKHVGIVYRYGHFSHVIGPGYHRLNSFSESLQGIIDISGRVLIVPVNNFRSHDSIPISVECAIVFKLAPFYFEHVQNGQERLANFIDMSRVAHKRVVTAFTAVAVRSILGNFTCSDLCNGANLTLFQDQISKLLAKELSKRAYQLVGQVVVNEIILPHGLELKRQDNVSRQELTEVLKSIPPHLYDRFFRAEFLEHLSQTNGDVNIYTDFDTMPHPEPDAPRTQYRGNGRSPQPPRSNNQSTYLNQ